MCVCVCSDSRNDVPRVAQRYGTIAAHTWRRSSVLVVFVVFWVHITDLPVLRSRTPPPTFSDTATTDRHSDTTIFLGADILVYWIAKIVRTCAKKTQLAPTTVDETDYNPRKRWRLIQELLRHFWRRWLREWLPGLRERKKWSQQRRDIQVGEVVLVVSPDTSRGNWPLGRVFEV